ncbi:hypothetical protein PHLGIDRAFT_139211 [Phlebiopsis gigantea 11061_1 CR5-6]|uniref:Uncharacterized protein n=1 Tax=Phlebiopsis gigantea (strain 11061_1 CR5-6) TaxID=745531 RepID=A0A0C3S5F5_PHLG1|nr:hypothetical protein PHLGIDRAFT_139211 [Phlebiopsis gigantea 11061_1 CR5-6]
MTMMYERFICGLWPVLKERALDAQRTPLPLAPDVLATALSLLEPPAAATRSPAPGQGLAALVCPARRTAHGAGALRAAQQGHTDEFQRRGGQGRTLGGRGRGGRRQRRPGRVRADDLRARGAGPGADGAVRGAVRARGGRARGRAQRVEEGRPVPRREPVALVRDRPAAAAERRVPVRARARGRGDGARAARVHGRASRAGHTVHRGHAGGPERVVQPCISQRRHLHARPRPLRAPYPKSFQRDKHPQLSRSHEGDRTHPSVPRVVAHGPIHPPNPPRPGLLPPTARRFQLQPRAHRSIRHRARQRRRRIANGHRRGRHAAAAAELPRARGDLLRAAQPRIRAARAAGPPPGAPPPLLPTAHRGRAARARRGRRAPRRLAVAPRGHAPALPGRPRVPARARGGARRAARHAPRRPRRVPAHRGHAPRDAARRPGPRVAHLACRPRGGHAPRETARRAVRARKVRRRRRPQRGGVQEEQVREDVWRLLRTRTQ